MIRLLALASLRFHGRHPWQLGLAIAGVALGVAVYVGVELANSSARRAFELSTDMLRGATTHRLLPVGGTLPERRYVEMVRSGRVSAAAPIVELEARLGTRTGPPGVVLGIDAVKDVAFRSYRITDGGNAGGLLTRLPAEPGSALLADSFAAQRGIGVGDVMALWHDDRRHTLTIIGLFDDSSQGNAPLVTDIATAQLIGETVGGLSRVDLRLSSDAALRLRSALPPGIVLVDADANAATTREMTRAFTTNLTALGLLSLVVGAFLIYATMSFAVLRRRPMLGVYRAVGLDDAELFRGLVVEAAVIGLAGTVLGLLLGRLLADGLTGMVLRTIGDFFFEREIRGVSPSPWIYVNGAVTGIGVTVAAGLAPALDAVRGATDATFRRSALEQRTRRRSRAGIAAGLLAFGLAAALLAMPTRSLVIAFGALFCVLAGTALMTPAATGALMRMLEPAAARAGLGWLLATREVGASLSRTGVAAAALAIAVATVIGIGLMIGSFRTSLIGWIDASLTADVYVTLAEPVGLDAVEASVDSLAGRDGFVGYGLSRMTTLPTAYGRVGLRALRAGPDGYGLDLSGGGQPVLDRGDRLLASESFAYRHQLGAGDSIDLPTAGGTRSFVIAGLVRDYGTTGGALVVDFGTYLTHWQDASVTGIGLHLAPGTAPADFVAAARAAFVGLPVSRYRSTESIRRVSLEVFDRTFLITDVLRALAGGVAFLGIVSAALAIQLERSRRTAVLRALGLAPGDLVRLSLAETSLLGLAAGLIALPLGVVLSALLVFVINRRSFGWTMDFVPTAGPLVSGLALAVGAAVLAGIYPAIRGARSALPAVMRDD